MHYDVFALKKLVKDKNVQALKQFMDEHYLVLEGNKIVPMPDLRVKLKEESNFWSQRQQARKILLG